MIGWELYTVQSARDPNTADLPTWRVYTAGNETVSIETTKLHKLLVVKCYNMSVASVCICLCLSSICVCSCMAWMCVYVLLFIFVYLYSIKV